MPRKKAVDIEQDVIEERWFFIQCLARNDEYLALLEEHQKFKTEWLAAKNAWQPTPLVLYDYWMKEWMNDPNSRSDPPKALTAALERGLEMPMKKREAMAFLRKARVDGRTRKKFMALLSTMPFPESGPGKDRIDTAAQHLIRLHRQAKARFGVAQVWDPRPFKGVSLEDLGSHSTMFFDSIQIFKPKVPIEGQIRSGDLSEPDRSTNPDRGDEGFLEFCENGVDLFMVADVRHTARRLKHDFEEILAKLDRLKRRGRLAAFPTRPAADMWKLYLRVWDLRAKGMTNADVAREVLGSLYKRNARGARTRADDYYKQARFWISLEWARHLHGVSPKGDA